MTEPRVEAGDRALETARNIADEQSRFDVGCSPLPVAEVAALIQSAMNAQERELREALINQLHKLPEYPFHAWDRENTGRHQVLIGLDDVVELLVEREGK